MHNLTFEEARLRLLAYVRGQVRNGEFTEREFARIIGISQPHAHNVLKGVRTLSADIFDLALKNLHLSLLDLAPLEAVEDQLRRRTPARSSEIALLESPIGPGRPWLGGMTSGASFPLPFSSVIAAGGLLMARLALDPGMAATIGPCDMGLLDTSWEARSSISPQGVYVVERHEEVFLRYVRSGASCYYLAADDNLDNPASWEPLAWSSAHLIAAVKARLRWLGRELDRDSMFQRGRFLYDPISS